MEELSISLEELMISLEQRATIDIPRQDDDVLVTNESNQDDEYISYSSSNDDIMLTEPNSKI